MGFNSAFKGLNTRYVL